jgi:heme-degrading monooxygenase HmoA
MDAQRAVWPRHLNVIHRRWCATPYHRAPFSLPRWEPPVYSSTFIFATRQFDDAFHRLDQQIAAAAKSIPGYLGEESWENTATGQVCNVYYWESLEALQQLVQNPQHRVAKARQGEWLNGYRVEISQVLRTYGDNRLPAAPAVSQAAQ